MNFNQWFDAFLRSGHSQSPGLVAGMAWEAALEEAAKLCDEAEDNANHGFGDMADNIRALKISASAPKL